MYVGQVAFRHPPDGHARTAVVGDGAAVNYHRSAVARRRDAEAAVARHLDVGQLERDVRSNARPVSVVVRYDGRLEADPRLVAGDPGAVLPDGDVGALDAAGLTGQ